MAEEVVQVEVVGTPSSITIEEEPGVEIFIEDEVIDLVTVSEPGPQGVQGVQGIQGLPGLAGSAPQAYRHTQTIPSQVWTVQHNLGYNPAGIWVKDDLGRRRFPAVDYISVNVLLLTFSEPVPVGSGVATADLS